MSLLASIVERYALPSTDTSGYGPRYVELAESAGLNLAVAVALAERTPLSPRLQQRRDQAIAARAAERN